MVGDLDQRVHKPYFINNYTPFNNKIVKNIFWLHV